MEMWVVIIYGPESFAGAACYFFETENEAKTHLEDLLKRVKPTEVYIGQVKEVYHENS